MNNPFKIKEVKAFLVSHKVDACVLLETRIRCQMLGKCRRILIGWQHANLIVQLLDVHEQFMFCHVRNGKRDFHLADVYGLHSIVDRRPLWSGLQQHTQGNLPLIVIGYFNADAMVSSY